MERLDRMHHELWMDCILNVGGNLYPERRIKCVSKTKFSRIPAEQGSTVKEEQEHCNHERLILRSSTASHESIANSAKIAAAVREVPIK